MVGLTAPTGKISGFTAPTGRMSGLTPFATGKISGFTPCMPPVKLLDTRFIDEARTKSFFESGKWSNDDRAELYTRAQHAMMKRCLTPANYRSAEQNATSQMRSLMLQLGFKKVAVKVGKRK